MREKEPFSIPIAARPQVGNLPLRINPQDKLRRNVGMNVQEDHEFRLICQFGSNQLIACYGCILEGSYNKYDFLEMCHTCEHYVGYNNLQIFDSLDLDIWKPYFMEKFCQDNGIEIMSDNAGAYVYFMSDGQYLKIGKAKDYKKRLSHIQIANARTIKIQYLIPVKDETCAFKIEGFLHRAYMSYQMNGEWYDIMGKLQKIFWRKYDPSITYEEDEEIQGEWGD